MRKRTREKASRPPDATRQGGSSRRKPFGNAFENDGPDPLLNIPDSQWISPEERLWATQRRRRALEMLESLPPREKEIVRLRYGMDGEPSRSLKEVGELVQLSRERVRQIAAEALRRLRAIEVQPRSDGNSSAGKEVTVS